MRKQKWLAWLMIMIMGLSCLVGCSGSGNDSDKKKGDASEIRIKYWNSGLREEWLNAVIDSFEKAHPEYTVKVESSASSTAVASTFGR